MTFTWNTDRLCVVFEWWRINSTLSLILSLIAVVALVAGYEALREGIRQYEAWVNKRAETAPRKFYPHHSVPHLYPSPPYRCPPLSSTLENPKLRSSAPGESATVTESTPFLWAGQSRTSVTNRAHVIKAVLYGIQNFYAFMIM